MGDTIDIKKSTLLKGLALIVLVVIGFAINLGSITGSITGSVINDGSAGNFVTSGDVQIVNMHVSGSSYVFEPSAVKVGDTVRLVADISRMSGCSKSIISSELGISKTFSSNDNTVDFVPKKAGNFYIACSMNMYKGTLEVLNSDGSKSGYVQKADTSASSCGMGGGGCGCGG